MYNSGKILFLITCSYSRIQKQCFKRAKSGMAKSRFYIANHTRKLLCIDYSSHLEDVGLKNHVE